MSYLIGEAPVYPMAKNPWIAALLSFILAGLGQIYVGAYLLGLLFLVLEALSATIYMYVDDSVGGMFNLVVGVVSMVDAYRRAKRCNLNHPEGLGTTAPEIEAPRQEKEEKEESEAKEEIRVF